MPDDDHPASAEPTESQSQQQAAVTTAPTGHDPYAAWRNRNYVLFISGFFVSVIAAQMQAVAARYEVFQKTGSELSLGWTGLALAVPMLLLTLPAVILPIPRAADAS